ncbi:hypothetical protein BRADI_4g11546v3 [Brachypodium distachyon]|uniref:Uncharacterized protein n=1 Tax=Brachypodium distachyon TaxID=15368 RepID=A0A2K2CM57_BRADI|nr:hypothetical protein BRADI_4g11546v3 [Brachypodium distachyon]
MLSRKTHDPSVHKLRMLSSETLLCVPHSPVGMVARLGDCVGVVGAAAFLNFWSSNFFRAEFDVYMSYLFMLALALVNVV